MSKGAQLNQGHETAAIDTDIEHLSSTATTNATDHLRVFKKEINGLACCNIHQT